jgi:hypothetical protein
LHIVLPSALRRDPALDKGYSSELIGLKDFWYVYFSSSSKELSLVRGALVLLIFFTRGLLEDLLALRRPFFLAFANDTTAFERSIQP